MAVTELRVIVRYPSIHRGLRKPLFFAAEDMNGDQPFDQNVVERYSSPREGSDYWAQLPAAISCWQKQAIVEVTPVALEFAPVLSCNLACSECPYRIVRTSKKLRRVKHGAFAEPDDELAITPGLAKLVLDKAAEAGVKVVLMTGGGEPTLLPQLPQMLEYSANLGLFNALYTNAIQIGLLPELAENLLKPANNLVFVRTSLNVASADVARRFAREREVEIEAQFAGFSALVEARDTLYSRNVSKGVHPPGISVSIICDERNVSDLKDIAARVAKISYRRKLVQKNDDVIVRLLTRHGRTSYSVRDHEDSVVRELLACFGPSGPGTQILANARLNIRLGFGLDRIQSGEFPSYSALLLNEYGQRDLCRAGGLFLTVGPNAKVYLCTDRNCYQEWEIGDLRTMSVAEIYNSEQRKRLLDKVHHERCGPSVCEATCRAARINRIARAIQSGEITTAEIREIGTRSSSERPVLLS